MSFFKNLFKPPASKVPPAPTPLPKLTTPSASALAGKFAPSAAAAPVVNSSPSASDLVHNLQQENLSEDAVKALAHGMPDREAVWWAAKSAEKVPGNVPPADLAATRAAEAWVKNPSDATLQAASEAAAKTDFQGPGAWAAQAAAFTKPQPAAVQIPQAAPVQLPTSGNLTAQAVAGAVMVAASLAAPKSPSASPPASPQLKVPSLPVVQTPLAAAPPPSPTPAEQAATAKALNPFIDLGKDIASGKNTWA